MGLINNKNGVSDESAEIVSPWFGVLMIVVTCVSLVAILYKPVQEFKTNDSYPPVISLTPQSIIKFGGKPAPIVTGMYVRDFSEFDMVKGIFVLDATVWFQFNPQLISLDRVSQFTFEKANIIEKSKPYTRIKGDDLIARFDMRMKFNMTFNYKDFPLDDHRLNFTLANYFISPADAVFKASRSNFVTSAEIHVDGWNYVDKQVKSGYIEKNLNPYEKQQTIYHPRVVFSMDYERLGVRHIISIFIPLLVIFFIALFSFSLHPATATVYNVVSMSSAAITGLIAYRFVIESMSPSVGYFMLSDYIFIFFLLMTSIVLFVNIVGFAAATWVKKIVVIVLHVATVLVFFYLIVPWI